MTWLCDKIRHIFSWIYFTNLKKQENEQWWSSSFHYPSFPPLIKYLRFSTSFYFFKFQNENIWLKLRTCYINGNIQMKDHQWNSGEVCIDIIKNDENIYMFTNIYGASFYFWLPYVFLSKLMWILYYLIKLHSLFSW